MTQEAPVFGGREEVRVKIFRCSTGAKVPAYAKPGDSGVDLSCTADVTLYPGVPSFISTGIAVAIPDGYEGQVRPRSGFSKRGIVTSWGTIDSGFRGPIGVILTLAYWGPEMLTDRFDIKSGERIAQLVIVPVPRVTFDEVSDLESLGSTERGDSGWGSSGL